MKKDLSVWLQNISERKQRKDSVNILVYSNDNHVMFLISQLLKGILNCLS